MDLLLSSYTLRVQKIRRNYEMLIQGMNFFYTIATATTKDSVKHL